jgi:ABC-type Fe3+/spermidine/putrescine transport system ATPase subunit
LAGLEKPDSGFVSWQGINLEDIPSHRRGFGLMFQDYALFPHMDVFGNVAFGLRMSGKEQATINDRVSEVLDLVNLSGFEHREISTLSGGEAQRVALARALAPQPSLLMLDEPLGSVDRTLKEWLLAELSRILRQLSQTAIYVTHDQEEAFTIADRVVLLNKGQVEQIGLPQDIYSCPSSRFVAEFLGLTNLLPGFVKESSGNTLVSTPLGEFSVDTAHRGNVTVLIHPEGMTLFKERFSTR